MDASSVTISRTSSRASGPPRLPGRSPEPVSLANFGRNVRLIAHRLTPRTEADVLEILAVHRDRRLRVLGALHSWSEVAASDDLVLDLRHFRGLCVRQTLDGATVTAGAAVTIGEILIALGRRGLTLPTVGAITRQTIAGAIATGTHGSGKPSLSHYVRRMRIANYEPATATPQVLELTDPDSVDELRAARCSLGRLGVVLTVTLEAVPDYDVQETLALVDSLEQAQATASDAPLQQFVLLPYAWRYYVYRRRAVRRQSPCIAAWLSARAYRAYKLGVVDVGLHAVVKGLAHLSSGRATRFLYRRLLPAAALRNKSFVDASTPALTLRHDLYRHVEMEMYVPAHQLRRALAAVREVTDVFADIGPTPSWLPADLKEELDRRRGEYTHHYPIPCRRVEADETLLSPTGGNRGEHYAVGIFNYGGPNPGYETFTAFLARCLTTLFGATLHWGKYVPTIDPGWVARSYPELDRFNALAKRYDPDGVFGNRFTDALLGLGLSGRRLE